MGDLIKNARLEQKMSQAELAKKAYFQQASISQIENGKREVSSSELLYFSYALNKPISYFFPAPYNKVFDSENISELNQELLLVSEQLLEDDLKRIIAQARALKDL